VVCTTDWAANEFARLGVTNLQRVPLGVDLDVFSPAALAPGVRARYAADDEVLVVHCGRLSPEKKPERSIVALEALLAAGMPAVLVVAGDGLSRERMERRAQGLPVRFTGFVHDRRALAALLASADVVLAPGPVETFGLAALEALSCGTPVVVDAGSALPEVIGGAGVAVRDEGFAKGVLDVLSWPVAGRRQAARRRAEEFGWPNAVAGFLAAHGLAPVDRSPAPTGPGADLLLAQSPDATAVPA
jgi:alpha-1,6-mannosyltransferase